MEKDFESGAPPLPLFNCLRLLFAKGWGQPVSPGWDGVVHNTDMKDPIDIEELVFPPAPPF